VELPALIGAWPWGVALVRWARDKSLKWPAAILAGALSATLIAAIPTAAQAQGFFDFLFGGFHERPAAPPQVSSYAAPSAPIAPPSLGRENVRAGGSTGRSVVFCVRLCDGESFPMDHAVNATPVDTCRAMCPASKTKVFYGGGIDNAVARDGQHYADLDNAFVYRKHLVVNCTCNGRDAFGLVPFDAKNDPTLRPGDIVMTANGPMAYAGKRGQTAAFTPVDPSSIGAGLNAVTPQRVSRRLEPPVEDDPGTIVESQNSQPHDLPPVVDLRGQVDR
jgi:hypothetical protein